MTSHAGIELFSQELKITTDLYPSFESPRSLSEGQRVRVRRMSARLVEMAVTTTATAQNGAGFSFTRTEGQKQTALYSADGTITKALPDSPPSPSDANTIHFTPDPEFYTTDEGGLYKRTRPPLVIPLDSYADFTVTALH